MNSTDGAPSLTEFTVDLQTRKSASEYKAIHTVTEDAQVLQDHMAGELSLT